MECLFFCCIRLGDTAGGGDDWGSDYALCINVLYTYSSPSSMIARRSTLISHNFAATQKVIHEEGLIENSKVMGERLNNSESTTIL